jgi:hypothetical protein
MLYVHLPIAMTNSILVLREISIAFTKCIKASLEINVTPIFNHVKGKIA